MPKPHFKKNVEQVFDAKFIAKNCITCAHWKDKKALFGEEWKGTYSGKCTKTSTETPPIHTCRSWERK